MYTGDLRFSETNVESVSAGNLRVGDILGVPNGDGLYVVSRVNYDSIYVSKAYTGGLLYTIPLPRTNTRYYRLKNI